MVAQKDWICTTRKCMLISVSIELTYLNMQPYYNDWKGFTSRRGGKKTANWVVRKSECDSAQCEEVLKLNLYKEGL